MHPQIDLDKRPPLGPFRLANEMHARFLRRVIGLARVARNAGANNVLPSRGTAAITRDHMIQIQILPVKNLAAILAGVEVPLKNIMPRELHFLFRHPVEHDEQDHARHADFKRDGMNAFWMRLLLGQIMPLIKTESLKRPIVAAEDSLGMPFKKQSKGASGGANIDRLP